MVVNKFYLNLKHKASKGKIRATRTGDILSLFIGQLNLMDYRLNISL